MYSTSSVVSKNRNFYFCLNVCTRRTTPCANKFLVEASLHYHPHSVPFYFIAFFIFEKCLLVYLLLIVICESRSGARALNLIFRSCSLERRAEKLATWLGRSPARFLCTPAQSFVYSTVCVLLHYFSCWGMKCNEHEKESKTNTTYNQQGK